MNRAPKLVVFDLDDTLIDTSSVFHGVREDFVAFMAARGFPEARVRPALDRIEERNLQRFGYISERNLISLREAYEGLVAGSAVVVTPDDLRAIASIAGRLLYTIPKPLDHARALLAWCASKFRLAMITRGSAALQNAKIDALKIRQHFEVVQVVEWKTAAIFKQLAESLGHTPDQCVSIGDSMRFDILTALEAGMTAVHFTYPYPDIQWDHDKARGVAGKALYQAKDLTEVKHVLEGLLASEGATTR
jgi:putative hydrolase of the HAD superfamily